MSDQASSCPNCGRPARDAIAKSLKHCRGCGSALDERAEICVSCGTAPLSQRNYCQNCGAATSHEQEVCLRCGLRLEAVDPLDTSKLSAYYKEEF
jgi:RNA polymerase subunit RPABC4/transcription elongation factor Spt4